MSELLLEFFSEEIPAVMQRRAANDLRTLVIDGLKARGLDTGEAKAFATPRRLTLVVAGVPEQSPPVSEEKKGPRVGAPEQAVAGFLKSAGLASVQEATVVRDEKKGDYYIARIERPGREAAEIVAETVQDVAGKFPWPKSMRWGSSQFKWVRPLQSILCLLGSKAVPVTVAGLQSGVETRGHRFLAPAVFSVKDFASYAAKLEAHKVILDPEVRAARIVELARALAKAAKLEAVLDDGLLQENAGLVEWPVVLTGTFDAAFLDVPAECLITSMKTHQKCFPMREPHTGKLSNKFLLVSNLEARDAGAAIAAGNEKVMRARLSDAKFFWEQDLKKPLDEMASALSNITFHEKLGSQKDRVERISELAFQIAGSVDANGQDARRAGQLAKADLVSGMVGEFPELQGLMGRYYAERAGTKPEIARAIELHYKPKGPGDSLPRQDQSDAVACAVAIADKIDTLAGFWAIGEKPTGSGDPYQLRRAALGVIRIVLENDFRIPLTGLIKKAQALYPAAPQFRAPDLAEGLLSFFADRLKVFLRDSGRRHDLIDAVFSLGGQDDLALIVKRVEALDVFLKTDDGANVLAGVKRASNILSIEEKKDGKSYTGAYDLATLTGKAETSLAAAIESVKQDTAAAINVENFGGAMRALAELRAPVDGFFAETLVNDKDAAIRENRLRLLSEIRAATQTVADFSKISG